MNLSVIIPVYNAEKTLRTCCDSILSQSDSDMQVILVDDGSTDDTSRICDEIAEGDARVKVLHSPNGGPGAARNRGLDVATGTWIAFVDADDHCEEGYFAKMLEAADADLVIQGQDADKRYGKADIPHGIAENALLEKGSPWGKLFRKELIDREGIRFPENYRYGEDTVFFLRYLAVCDSIRCIGECGYRYAGAYGDGLSGKTHESLDLLHYICDSQDAIRPFLSDREVARRHNAKCVFYAKRAWNNMRILGYDRSRRKETTAFLRSHILPRLRFDGLNFRESLYLILFHLAR